jgi:glycine/D-amino acid oxidase-like deaminating enzyme
MSAPERRLSMNRRQFLQSLAATAFAGTARAASALHVVVAGAGIIGASIAWHLAKAGARVTVIDREGPATHASRGSFAWINATWSKQPQRYHRLNQAGVEGWRALEEALKLPVRWGGSLEGVADAAVEAGLPARVAEQLAWGEKTRIVDRDELASLEPNVDFGALRQVVLSGNDGATDPIAATRTFLDAATALGAKVAYPCELTGVGLSSGRVSGVRTSRGDITAERLVLATGAAADAGRRFADWDLPQRSAPGLTAILKGPVRDRDRRGFVGVRSGNSRERTGTRSGDIRRGRRLRRHVRRVPSCAARGEWNRTRTCDDARNAGRWCCG